MKYLLIKKFLSAKILPLLLNQTEGKQKEFTSSLAADKLKKIQIFPIQTV